MKKLLMITLSLLLFTFFSPVQAKRPGPLDRPLPDYNNLSLRQIFEDGNMLFGNNYIDVNNNNIIDGYGAYPSTNTFNINNGQQINYNVDSVEKKWVTLTKSFNWLNNHYYYINITNTIDTSNEVGNLIIWGYVSNQSISMWQRSKPVGLINDNLSTIKLYDKTSGFYSMLIGFRNDNDLTNINSYILMQDYYMIDLTALGIPTATKIEMDNLYSDYLKYKDMMTATDVMLIVGQLVAFVWSLVVSFEVFGFVLWEYALFGIGAGFIGYLALKIIQKKAGDDNGDSD